jgi:hypothetical protein
MAAAHGPLSLPEPPKGVFSSRRQFAVEVQPIRESGLVCLEEPGNKRIIPAEFGLQPIDLQAQGVGRLLLKEIRDRRMLEHESTPSGLIRLFQVDHRRYERHGQFQSGSPTSTNAAQ